MTERAAMAATASREMTPATIVGMTRLLALLEGVGETAITTGEGLRSGEGDGEGSGDGDGDGEGLGVGVGGFGVGLGEGGRTDGGVRVGAGCGGGGGMGLGAGGAGLGVGAGEADGEGLGTRESADAAMVPTENSEPAKIAPRIAIPGAQLE